MSNNKETSDSQSQERQSLNFIEQMIEKDLAEGKHDSRVHTRFPPHPNGYLHIGHAKSICLNFGLSEKYNGKCNLRFDDTNPEKEDIEYINSIKEDIQWLGYEWDNEFYASDYFDQLYEYAIQLIKSGKAYIDDSSAEKISEDRGTPNTPGKLSEYRDRSVEENLSLFEAMKNGQVEEGTRVLRAKIDMASPIMQMRDPVIYRVKKAKHHRTGDRWSIYPTYDFAHGQSDALEKITHSLCTLEFASHRPLYDWFIKELNLYPSEQTEFARLNLSYTIVSKRKLKELVEEGFVEGWDDPRMPTLAAIRRRGYTPESIRNFAAKVGVAKRDGVSDVALLEHSVREDLNKKANRVLGVLDPIKLIITNYPEGKTEMLPAVNNPEDESAGKREIPFGREVFIERDDFMEEPPKKYFRMGPEREVRLKYAYIVKCTGFKKNEAGEIVEVFAEYDPNTKSGHDTTGKKVKGTLGWVSAAHAVDAEVRLYDRLFGTENLNDIEDDFKNHLNPNSLTTMKQAKVEPSVGQMPPTSQFQFERLGYFIIDKDSDENKLRINRTVSLRDNWAKQKG